MGPALLFLSSHLAAARAEACLEGLLLLLAHAGAAGYLKNALCSVAVLGIMLPTVPDLAGKERKKHGKKWSYALHFPPGRLARWGWHGSSLSTTLAADVGRDPEGAEEGCAAGRRDRFLRLSPPTSGLAHRGRRRGQAAGRGVRFLRLLCQLRAWPAGGGGGPGGVRSWTGILLPTPLAADFGPNPQGVEEGGAAGQRGWFPSPLSADFWLGPETAAAEGRSAGTRVRFLSLSLPASGLARRWQRGGAQ